MSDSNQSGLFDLAEIDRVIHEPVRLSIMAYLYVVEGADYLFLKRQLGLTFGNLTTHMGKLQQAGYIEVEKSFRENKPNTKLRLTEKGKQAYDEYKRKMKTLIVE